MIWRSSLFSKITVHETPIGGNVAAQIEVHDVVRFLQVVGPFEIEGEIGVSRWQAEGSAWSRKIRIILSSPAKNLLAVRVLINSQPLPKKFKVQWTPTLVSLDEQGEEHNRTVGFLPPDELLPSLLLGMGKSYFDRDQLKEAEQTFQQLLTAYPRSDSSAEAAYYLGVSRYK